MIGPRSKEWKFKCAGGERPALSTRRTHERAKALPAGLARTPARFQPRSMDILVAQRPYVSGYSFEIGMRELGAAHGRHCAPVFLGVRHTVGDCPCNRSETAITPHPFAAREVRCERCALGVRTVAAFAGSAALTVVHTLAALDLRGGGAGRDRQGSDGRLGASIRMNTFRRFHIPRRRRARTGSGSGFDARDRGPARKSHAPNASMRVV